MARRLFHLPSEWTGKKWLQNFRSRWSHVIKLRKPKSANRAREAPTLREECESFMAQYQEHINTLNLLPEHIINIDETKAEPNNHHDTSLVFGAAGNTETRVTQKTASDVKTLVTCAAASGKMWLTVKLYNEKGGASPKSKRPIQVSGTAPVKRNEWEALHLRNKNGFMTLGTWRLVVEKLVELMDCTRRDLPILILCDHPAVHHDMDLVRKMLSHNVHFLFFPHNSSHLLQPLDGAPFAVYKQSVRQFQCINRTKSAIQDDDKVDAVRSAEMISFSPEVIRAGFSKRGIWPINIEVVRAILSTEFSEPQDVQTDDWKAKAYEFKAAFVEVLNEATPRSTRKVSCLPEETQLYSGHDLLLLEDKKKAEKEKKLAEIEARKRERDRKREEKNQMQIEKRRKQEKNGQQALKRKKIPSNGIDPELKKNRSDSPPSGPPKKIRRIQVICSACSTNISSRQSIWLCKKCEAYRLCPNCTEWDIREKNHLRDCLGMAAESSLDVDRAD